MGEVQPMTISNRRSVIRNVILGCAAALLGGCTTAVVREPAAVAPAEPIAPVKVTPGDAFVFISGGGTPLSNNYSQYLQALGVNDGLRARFPSEAVWTFFGAGNRPDRAAVFGDTRRLLKEDSLLVESWLPGVLQGNRPARRAEIFAALKNEILPRVAHGGTLYLIVGDHGELSRGAVKESQITLWQMAPTAGAKGTGSWRTDTKEVLTVSELRAALTAGLGAGRVVFYLTCCHSGGFHHLDVPRSVPANPAWFSGFQPVECADWSAQVAPARMAGFTATTEDSLAAGCVPDPDPEKWRGQERHFPEALFGVDLMTGEKKGGALPSFAAAHEAAVLVNRTIDKPFSTAEMWLERYATLIETVVKDSPALTPKARAAAERYERIVEGEMTGVSDAKWLATERRYARFVEALTEQNFSSAVLLGGGTRAQLEAAIGTKPGNAGGSAARRRGAPDETKKLWTETIRPAWKAALQAGTVKGVPKEARAFELHLIGLEEKNPSRIFLPGDRSAVRNELFWQSSSAIPATADAKKAAVLGRWEAGRRAAVLAWARTATDEKVKAAAVKWAGPVRAAPAAAATSTALRATIPGFGQGERKEALQRALFYRRVLGAWAFLIAVDERGALERLAALQALEETPLPVVKS
jgi:hypothetical protein